MELIAKIGVYVAAIAYAIIKAYRLGFLNGEDKGRKDMQARMIDKSH